MYELMQHEQNTLETNDKHLLYLLMCWFDFIIYYILGYISDELGFLSSFK